MFLLRSRRELEPRTTEACSKSAAVFWMDSGSKLSNVLKILETLLALIL
jgi:hypothetical protein